MDDAGRGTERGFLGWLGVAAGEFEGVCKMGGGDDHLSQDKARVLEADDDGQGNQTGAASKHRYGLSERRCAR
jgi:hypothetical protein